MASLLASIELNHCFVIWPVWLTGMVYFTQAKRPAVGKFKRKPHESTPSLFKIIWTNQANLIQKVEWFYRVAIVSYWAIGVLSSAMDTKRFTSMTHISYRESKSLFFFFGIQKFMKNSSDQALFREQKNLIDVRHQVIFEVVWQVVILGQNDWLSSTVHFVLVHEVSRGKWTRRAQG